MSDIKDPVLDFLETVTYDEVMAYFYAMRTASEGPDSHSEQLWDIVNAHYHWDDERRYYLAMLTNYHQLQIPNRDWRINYFLSLGKGFPEETLSEQYGELKAQGDTLERMVVNALRYQVRITELRTVVDAITVLYPLVYLVDKDEELPIAPDDARKPTISAYADTVNIHLQHIQALVETHFAQTWVHCFTPDIEALRVRGVSGKPTLLFGELYRRSKSSQIIGMDGTFRLDQRKPVVFSPVVH